MSYSFKVKFDGTQGTVADFAGTPPEDGSVILVSGHSDPSQTNIGATLIDPSGTRVVQTFVQTYATGRTS